MGSFTKRITRRSPKAPSETPMDGLLQVPGFPSWARISQESRELTIVADQLARELVEAAGYSPDVVTVQMVERFQRKLAKACREKIPARRFSADWWRLFELRAAGALAEVL